MLKLSRLKRQMDSLRLRCVFIRIRSCLLILSFWHRLFPTQKQLHDMSAKLKKLEGYNEGLYKLHDDMWHFLLEIACNEDNTAMKDYLRGHTVSIKDIGLSISDGMEEALDNGLLK